MWGLFRVLAPRGSDFPLVSGPVPSEVLRKLNKALNHLPLSPTAGPGPLEALAAGCVFIQPAFSPPHSKSTTTFLAGKPTSRDLGSQVPYLQHFVGEPYVSHMTTLTCHMTGARNCTFMSHDCTETSCDSISCCMATLLTHDCIVLSHDWSALSHD